MLFDLFNQPVNCNQSQFIEVAHGAIFMDQNKEERSRGTVDSAQKRHITNLVGLFWLCAQAAGYP